MRLDKYLSNAGMGSRKDVGKMIKKGGITVNGETVKSPKKDVDYNDTVASEGVPVHLEEYIYYMLHKPPGVISSTEKGQTKTVIDIIDHPQKKELFPVGRLDKDTTGLLLITNDGKLAHKLTSPKKDFGKTYDVTLRDPVTEEALQILQAGIPLKDFHTKPAEAKRIHETMVRLTITEGKYHQVKRMFRYLGNEVTSLKRISFATLPLDNSLKPGDYRHLTQSEKEILRKLV